MVSTVRRVIMGLLDEMIFSFLGLESPSLLELIFAGSAVIGGGLFLFWFAFIKYSTTITFLYTHNDGTSTATNPAQ